MIKRVLVYLYGKLSHENTLKAAANFAARHDASLTGLFVTPDFMNYATVYGGYPLNLAQSYFDMQDKLEDEAHEEFDRILEPFECETEWHRLSEQDAHSHPAIYSDIIFISQPSQESSVIFNDVDFADYLILETGVPTVIVPAKWEADRLARHPMLGWKETREAVGAVRHTLPLMRQAEEVDIVTVVRKHDREEELVSGIEISAYLSVHDINCKFFTETVERDEDEADTLMRHAREQECDLIIIGGYGHSRFREIILGGVTRELVHSSDVPVLVSH